MGEISTIQWTDATWNPWHGCKKVSAGCKFCYMYRDKERYGQDPTAVIRSKGKFREPLKWKEPRRVFTCSWSDWFIQEADQWRPEAWEIIKATPHLQYQILTKRPERIAGALPADWGNGYPNVWIGMSVENQEAMELRMPFFAEFEAVVKFVSCEPLLGPVQIPIDTNDGSTFFDWMIIGGESGNDKGNYRYRPAEVNWFLDLIHQCKKAGCPVFMKQMGTYIAKNYGLIDRHGGDMNEWLPSLCVREFPNIDAWNRKI